METNFNVFFIDLDGTTIDIPEEQNTENLGISEQNLYALQQISKKKPIIISTGRANSEFVLNVANKIGALYCICMNGSLIVDSNNNIIKTTPIDEKTTINLLEYMQFHNLFYTMNEGGIIYYGNKQSCEFERPWVKWHKKLPYAERPNIKTPCKFLCYGVSKEEIDKIIIELRQKLPNLEFHKVSYGYSIEITNKNASKGKGGQYVASLLNIDPKKACHIGDTGNDINSLPEIGTFIAMGNATDEVKKHAKIIAPDFRNSGLYKLFKSLKEI